MSFDIKNKTALVTGANRGIGKAIVESFLTHGASKVYLAIRNPESAQELQQKYGNQVVALQFDATDPQSIKAAAETAVDVDVVVNNAGILEIADPLAPHAEEVLAKEMLPEDVVHYLKEEFRAEFRQLRSMKDRKLY